MAVSSSATSTIATTTTTATMPVIGGVGGGVVVPNAAVPSHQNTVPSATMHPLMSIPSSTTITTTKTTTATATNPTINLTFSSFPPANPTTLPLPPLQPQPQPGAAVVVEPSSATANPLPNIPTSIFHSISADLISNYSTSSSTSTDDYGEEEEEAATETEGRRKKRKRKWKDFFERLMKEVIRKQEDLQKRFLEAVEKREQERAVREEAWRMQEMARINREREILAQERSIAAAKDAAVMAFLQKMSSEQQQQPQPQSQPQPQQPQPQPQPQPQQQIRNINLPPPPPPPLQVQQQIPVPPVAPVASLAAPAAAAAAVAPVVTTKGDSTNGEKFMGGASSSRWPKTEVQALIKLRTSLDAKYQESGPKGPLWEEISAGMRRIGYNRNAKRCKEKWENINKYFKKVKESNKKRPEDSKTCPYFHQLDALYREKNKFDSSNTQIKPENAIPLMVRPEQQWPPQNHPDSGMESDPMDHNNEEEEEDKDDEDDDDDVDDDEEDDDEGGGNYELVANRPPPPATSVSAAE